MKEGILFVWKEKPLKRYKKASILPVLLKNNRETDFKREKCQHFYYLCRKLQELDLRECIPTRIKHCCMHTYTRQDYTIK